MIIIRKILNAIKIFFYQQPIYSYYYKKNQVKKNVILLESTHGKTFGGHLFYILKELKKEYFGLDIYIAVQNVDKLKFFLSDYQLSQVKVVKHMSKKYLSLLASAEYLLNDTTFYSFFIKKVGQKYINFWHGTPLKTLGQDGQNLTDAANVQRNFYMADKIVVSNDFLASILANSHGLNGIYQGKMVVAPSPRNAILLDAHTRDKVRLKLGINQRRVLFYVPTWRGNIDNIKIDSDIRTDLQHLANNLSDEFVLYVKFHPFTNNVNLDEFDSIFSMPAEYELYEFLAAVDVLITDYSSIMYDFVLVKRKIILYTYDKDEYFSTRGVYDDIDRYPFEQVENVHELLTCIHSCVVPMDNKLRPVTSSNDKAVAKADQADKQKFIPAEDVGGVRITDDDETKEFIPFNTTAGAKITDNDETTKDLSVVNFAAKAKINNKLSSKISTAEDAAENKVSYDEMINEFCPVDCLKGAKIVCDYIFKRIHHKCITEYSLLNKKETAIVLGGGFWDNGVTTALLNTFDNIELDKRNYVVLLGKKQLKKEYEFRVRNLSDKIIFYPFPETVTAGILNRLLYLAYMRIEWFDGAWVRTRVRSVVRDDYKRIMGDLQVDHFIHFTGFGNRYSELIKHVPNAVNTIMYVHTNMLAEYNAKKNFSKKIVFSAYEHVDKIAIVHQNLKEGLIQAVPAAREKLYVMNNFLGERRIRELAKAELLETLAAVLLDHGDKESLILDLFNQDISIFINIGRFDYQKGHDRLIAAFDAIYQENQNTRLVIIAPHGPLRSATLDLAASSVASSAIYFLGRMSNPYALLSRCGCFVLSSHYEGLGLVVYEALAVGIAVVTVDIKEVTEYLKNDEAIIVPSSVDGIAGGMRRYLLGDYSGNKFDFGYVLEQSKLEFEALFK